MTPKRSNRPKTRLNQGSERLKPLDGLRGLASMAVVLEHSLLVFAPFFAAFGSRSWPQSAAPTYANLATFTPLHLFWAGGEAVAIFFVLSGFVLSLQYWQAAQPPYTVFVVRRLARLYPVYLASLALAAGLFFAVPHDSVEPASTWLNRYWQLTLTVSDVLRALLFLPGAFIGINSPLWTLIHEMRVSLILPLLLLALDRAPWPTAAACVLISFASASALKFDWVVQTDIANLLETGGQLWYFMIGALAARHRAAWATRLAALPQSQQWTLLMTAILLTLLRWLVPVPAVLSHLATGIGSLLLLLLALSMPALVRILRGHSAHFAGAISYPLYAIHFPLIVAAVHGLDTWPLSGRVIVGIATAVPAAWIVHRLIETPAIRLGHAFRTRQHETRR